MKIFTFLILFFITSNTYAYTMDELLTYYNNCVSSSPPFYCINATLNVSIGDEAYILGGFILLALATIVSLRWMINIVRGA